MPVQDIIVQPESAPVVVALEPGHQAVHSMLLLTKAEKLSGLGEWVTRTAEAMTPEERRHHELVILGFFHAILPAESWSSFPAYVEHLATSNPVDLRDRMLAFYAQIAPKAPGSDRGDDGDAPRVVRAAVL